MRRLPIILLIFILLGLDGYGQAKNDVFQITTVNGSHKVKLIFKTRPFVAKDHKIRNVSDKKAAVQGTIIDGQYALGTDFSIPKTEIASVKLYFDGKEVPIVPSLYSNVYNPNLDKDYFWLKFGDDGKSVMAFMAGSDAAGSYQVFWVFRSDGKHTRFSNAVSDADYTDFVKMFFDSK